MAPWPGVTEPLSLLDPDPVAPDSANITDSDLILTRLREQIATGTQDADALLGAIAIAAQTMTDATGAALGMRRDGSVACVGRSGETAPALGARLSEDSGISGACLRQGRIQRCDDTASDPRVDAEVCRDLGLRSIAAVPIRSRLETVGILEVFSTSARAFTDQHLAHLSSLAELADVAGTKAIVDAPSPESMSPAVDLVSQPFPPISSSLGTVKAFLAKPLWRYLAVGGGVAVLALFSFATWRMWGELKSRDEAKPIIREAPTPVATASETALPDVRLSSKPSPRGTGSAETASKSLSKGGVVQAARIEAEPDDGLIRNIAVESSSNSKGAGSARVGKASTEDASASDPPQVAMVSSPGESLHGIFADQTLLPSLSPPLSQGVVPLALERQVMPSYPSNARMLRLEGKVLLRAVVSGEGKITQVKTVSGHPILAKAATDAVRQWRYRPALLNGVPTPIETDITLNFKLP